MTDGWMPENRACLLRLRARTCALARRLRGGVWLRRVSAFADALGSIQRAGRDGEGAEATVPPCMRARWSGRKARAGGGIAMTASAVHVFGFRNEGALPTHPAAAQWLGWFWMKQGNFFSTSERAELGLVSRIGLPDRWTTGE